MHHGNITYVFFVKRLSSILVQGKLVFTDVVLLRTPVFINNLRTPIAIILYLKSFPESTDDNNEIHKGKIMYGILDVCPGDHADIFPCNCVFQCYQTTKINLYYSKYACLQLAVLYYLFTVVYLTYFQESYRVGRPGRCHTHGVATQQRQNTFPLYVVT